MIKDILKDILYITLLCIPYALIFLCLVFLGYGLYNGKFVAPFKPYVLSTGERVFCQHTTQKNCGVWLEGCENGKTYVCQQNVVFE